VVASQFYPLNNKTECCFLKTSEGPLQNFKAWGHLGIVSAPPYIGYAIAYNENSQQNVTGVSLTAYLLGTVL